MQLVTHEVTRTTRTWENDAPAAQTTDYWSSDFPGGQYSQFIHAYLSWTSNSDGQPLRAVGIEQEIYGTSSDGATALSSRVRAGFADFHFDVGRLVSSDTTYWTESFQDTPVQLHDDYLVDALGRRFIVARSGSSGGLTSTFDGVFLFAPVLWMGYVGGTSISYSVFPNGVVSSYGSTGGRQWGSNTRTWHYDERGTLLEDDFDWIDRFGHLTPHAAKFTYDGGRLVSTDTGPSMNWNGPPPGHTDYRYDASGNNVERVTTDPSGNVQYIAVYDSAANLICERSVADRRDDFAHSFVRHYEYGCF
jgi:hypothetical protein